MTHPRLCFIGNSHLACIRLAWIDGARPVEFRSDIDFFASSASTMLGLQAEEGVLKPGSPELLDQIKYTSGGKTQIDVAEYDQFFLFGLSFGFRTTLEMARRHETLEHRKWVGARNLVSDKVFEQTIDDLLDMSSSAQLARLIRSITSKPITLVCQPCPGEGLLDRTGYLRFQKATETPYLAEIYDTFRRVALKVGERNGWRIVFQPEDTLVLPGFTKAEYAKAGVGVKKLAASPDDDKHMNPQYGQRQLASLLSVTAGVAA